MDLLNLSIGTILKAKKGVLQGKKVLKKCKITGILFSGMDKIRNENITVYDTIHIFSDGNTDENSLASYNIKDFFICA